MLNNVVVICMLLVFQRMVGSGVLKDPDPIDAVLNDKPALFLGMRDLRQLDREARKKQK